MTNDFSIHWSPPYEAWKNGLREMCVSRFVVWVRSLIYTGLILLAARHLLAPFCPPDLSWPLVGGLLLLYPILFGMLYFGEVWSLGRKLPEYALTGEGLFIPTRQRPLVRWDQVASYTIGTLRHQPDFKTLQIHLKMGAHFDLPLPPGNIQKSILAAVATHIPEHSPPSVYSPIRPADWILSSAAILFTAVLVGTWSIPAFIHHKTIVRDWGPWIVLILMFAGPGTWIALLLCGRRAKEQLTVFAMTLNMFSLLLLLVFFVTQTLSQFIR
jgi:hypothetical protein